MDEDVFRVYGLCKYGKSGKWTRVPDELLEKEKYADDMKELIHHTSGGRVRFKTDSPYICVRAQLYENSLSPHFSPSGKDGCDIYAKPAGAPGIPDYMRSVIPEKSGDSSYELSYEFPEQAEGFWDVTVNLPLYSGVEALFIGIKEGSSILPADPYRTEKPVLFYGSSITQGACSQRPGNSHVLILSRMLDCDVRNMGFSGSAYGESSMAEFISGLEMSAFVMEYDYNARSEDELLRTHYRFYETVREKNPELPVIMVSAPVAAPARVKFPQKRMAESRVIIMESYLKGYRSGDSNLYFVDGEGMIGSKESLVDGVHPDVSGFRNMAQKLYPVLRDVLYHY